MSPNFLVPSHCFSQREIISKRWSDRSIPDMFSIVNNNNISHRSHRLFFMSVYSLLKFICISLSVYLSFHLKITSFSCNVNNDLLLFNFLSMTGFE